MATRRAELLEFAVLGLLHESPLHGYELRKRLNAALGPFRALSYGTLYPCLRDLTDRGLIAPEHAVGTPSVPTAGRRTRQTYELTADGKEHFVEQAARADASAFEDEDFDVRFAFFARTQAQVRLRILEGRRSRLEERLATARAASARNRARMDSYTTALQQRGEESTEREVRWLSELITAEQAAGPQPAAGSSIGTPSTTGTPSTPAVDDGIPAPPQSTTPSHKE